MSRPRRDAAEAIADRAIGLFVEALRREGVRLELNCTVVAMAENEPLVQQARGYAVEEVSAPVKQRVSAREVVEGDVLPDPHLSGRPGVVTKVVPTWYGSAVYYVYDDHECVSAVFSGAYEDDPNCRNLVGIEVERPCWWSPSD